MSACLSMSPDSAAQLGAIDVAAGTLDVWGDPVNVASRMESTAEPGKIQVSADTYELLKEDFWLERRGPIDIKGKGEMETWYLRGRKADEPA